MRAAIARVLGVAAVGAVASALSFAQGDWGFQCVDPENETPRTPDHFATGVGNDLMISAMGVSGNVTYGGQNGPCYAPNAVTNNLAGRFGFQVGFRGSVQDQNPADPQNSGFRDDLMALTVGMPTDPSGSYCYATTTKNETRTLWGSAGFSLLFTGASNRYYYAESTLDNVFVQLKIDVVADATRMQWRLTNLDTETANLGLWFGASMGMLTVADFITDLNGANQSHSNLGTLTRSFTRKPGYVYLPVGRPPRTDQRYTRALDPANFPTMIDFVFGQTANYGMRIETGASPSTTDPISGQSDATEASEFVLGKQTFLMGGPGGDPTFSDVTLPDTTFLQSVGFIQKYAELPVTANGTRTIVQYIRSTWGEANYSLPYAAVVDAPRLVANDPNNPAALRPNPMTIRVYVDNVGGYALVNQEIPLNDVKITLTLPPGLSMAPGDTAQKTITVVQPYAIAFVDFSVVPDGVISGSLPYSVKIEPIPGPTKVISGNIQVATAPRLDVLADANLVTFPWQFQDTSLENILGLNNPTDFQAYRWDPQLSGYIPATNAERGLSLWLVSNSNYGSVVLSGSPQIPGDIATGAPLIQLHSGWNLIGNPYPYAVPLGQLVGVSAANPQFSYTFAELVAQGVLSGAVVFWDNNTQDYTFVQGSDAVLQANRGYWMFVNTLQDVTISYPSVYALGLPGSFRGGESWSQSDKQWRLQLSVRSENSLDAQNFVGVARTEAEARLNRIYEPPTSPVHDVNLAVEEIIDGSPARLAQTLTTGQARKTWKLIATAQTAGQFTLTWPNLTTVPKNVRFRITDVATGETRDLRQTSGYTFVTNDAGTREFRLEMSPGAASRAVIGNVVVNRDGRDAISPFVINYSLSSEATTTVRILSGSGREVFTVSRGRADSAGENSVTWMLRDNANRLVAPGSYRVEILAETDGGDRVRKVIPINVVR